jgi:hypothetical protein
MAHPGVVAVHTLWQLVRRQRQADLPVQSMQPRPSVSRSEFELVLMLYELEQTGRVANMFELASMLLLEISWTWRLTNRARDHGFVMIEYGGRGLPNHIGLTPHGRHMAQVSNHSADTLIHIIMDDKRLSDSSLLAATELHRRVHEEE